MTAEKWTIRGVNPAVIDQVRAIQAETGLALGEIVSVAIKLGIPSAVAELRSRHPHLTSQQKTLALIDKCKRDVEIARALIEKSGQFTQSRKK
jgi:hypothetical protein